MAHRGRDTLRFGPMKPVGLVDPRTGREPYAAVQLRQDNLAGDHFSLVGFQTQIKWGEQARVLRLIPGLEQAEFVRFGMVHRNTYVNGPTVLAETWQVRARPSLFFAGQMSGVEATSSRRRRGCSPGMNAAALANGEPVSAPPRTTAIGALAYYVSHANPAHYEPSNITFGIMEPLDRAPRGKRQRKLALSERALADLASWRWPTARSSRRLAATGGCMTEHLKAFLQFLALNRNASRAHGARLRERPVAVSRPRGRRRRRQDARSRRRRQLDRAAIRGFLAELHAQRAVARDGGAQAGRGAHVPALPAARRRSSTTIPARWSRRRSATCACRRTCPKTR